MATTNLPSKKNKKSNPTITRLSFECTGGVTKFIDVGLALSAVNRKFFRAGLFYYINSIEVYNNQRGVIDIHTAPDNWITRNAHQRGERLFDKMNALVDEVSAVGRPAYHDFKVYLSDLHRTTGSLQPSVYNINATASSVLTDEWEYSQYTSADDDGDATQDADNFTSHLLGPHAGSPDNWSSIGLIKSYSESRNTVPSSSPSDVNIDITDPLMNLFDFSSEEQMNDIILNLQAHNDQPPYNFDNYLGEAAGDMQHVGRVGTEIGLGRVGRMSGFCAPFGLICIDPHSATDAAGETEPMSAFRVVLNLAVGSYKGVYAERA